MTKKADRDQIRRQNRKILLQALRRNGPTARIDLGRLTRLSPATVTAITSDMLDQGLIIGVEGDEPKAPMGRGRPRRLLTVNPDAALVLSIRLSVNSIDFSLANFGGEVTHQQSISFDSCSADADAFPKLLVSEIMTFLESCGTAPTSVGDITVAAQGVVDLAAGTVVWSPAFVGRDIPIVVPLQAALDAPCTLSNDTNMITEALHWSDPVKYSGTFAVMMIDYGVGMGLYLEDHIYAGAHGRAAEIGHTNHVPGGALCRCGKRGCLEAYLADYAIARAAAGLPETADPNSEQVTHDSYEGIVAKAKDGDEQALAIFSSTGRVLGFGLARILAMIDPKRIVLTGAIANAYSYMEASAMAALEDALVEDLRGDYSIEILPWDTDLIQRGLIAQAMQRLDRELLDRPRSTVSDRPAIAVEA